MSKPTLEVTFWVYFINSPSWNTPEMCQYIFILILKYTHKSDFGVVYEISSYEWANIPVY